MNFTVNKPEKLIKSLIHNIQGMSFGSAQKSIRLGKIKINGKRIKDNINVNTGDIIEVYEFKKSKPQVDILYKDDNIIIANKPQGIECATRDKSSANTYSLEEILEEYNPIVVHRLDRLTEGIIILARNKDIAKKFEEIFRTRQINKYYKAFVYGMPKKTGVLTAYLKKNPQTSTVDVCDTLKEGFKQIITEITIEDNYNNYSTLDIKLHTGRTHQIRAHLAHIGHSIVGDDKYCKNQNIVSKNDIPSRNYPGYFLTAYKIEFNVLDEQLSYLNDLNIEITPTWKQFITKE